MKLNGIIGKGTGKLGSSVFAVSGGVQIMREYNPNVSNPNTDAQVAQRAKLKLMSQLAAALAAGIVIRKDGLVSSRNKFVSKNIALCTFEEGQAIVPLAELQLSEGKIELGDLSVTPQVGGRIDISLNAPAPVEVKQVAYVLARKTDNEKIVVQSVTVIDRQDGGLFEALLDGVSAAEYVLYAYGVIPKSGGQSVTYEDYVASLGDTIANLDTSKFLRSSGNSYTATSGHQFINTPE